MVKKSKSNLNVLNQELLESYYWAGFIAADGYLRKRGNKVLLKIKLADKDLSHLKTYQRYIQSSNKLVRNVTKAHLLGERKIKKSYSWSLESGDTRALTSFMKKYDLKERKTYCPPNFKMYLKFKNEYLLSFFIGLIDGDGTIKKRKDRKSGCSITLRCHKNWRLFLKKLCLKLNLILEETLSPSLIKNTNLVGFSIFKRKTLSNLKSFSIRNKLPVLDRKWSKL